MPITPFHRADLLVALLRAKRPRHSFDEQDWLKALQALDYDNPAQLLRDAISAKLLVRDYSYPNHVRYQLADEKMEHCPVAYFHEGFSQRAGQRALPASARQAKPKARSLPPTASHFPGTWQDPPPPPHPALHTRVNYFRSPIGEALPALPVLPAPPTTWPKHRDVALYQVYQAIATPDPRLARATALAGDLQGTAWEPLARGCLDYVAFGRVPEPGRNAVEPWLTLLLTLEPARQPFEDLRLDLLSDPQLRLPLLLLYGHPARHQLVAVLERPIGADDASGAAQYLDYFQRTYASRGLRCKLLPATKQGLVLGPVWHDPKAYFNQALWPVKGAAA